MKSTMSLRVRQNKIPKAWKTVQSRRKCLSTTCLTAQKPKTTWFGIDQACLQSLGIVFCLTLKLIVDFIVKTEAKMVERHVAIFPIN